MDWNLTSYFPQFQGTAMTEFKSSLSSDISVLLEDARRLAPLDAANFASWEQIFRRHEALTQKLSHLGSYIACLAAADARHQAYRDEEAALALTRAEFAKVRIELLRGCKNAADDLFACFLEQPSLDQARHFLHRLREESRTTMPVELEGLAADLNVNGLQAWGRLYNRLSGKLEFDMEFPDGRKQRLPISQRRALMENPDRRVRKMAFEGGNAAWETVADTTAAMLNAIAGTRLTLNRHRGVENFLDVALFQAGLKRKTLHAMLEAIVTEIDVARAVLRLKAAALQRKGVAWYDLGAPLSETKQGSPSWASAQKLVTDALGRTYPGFAEFFQTLFDQKWIDWQPRAGKRPGAFCTGSLLTRESRIFMTYNETMGDVLTLAHESGHAFHSHQLRHLRPYACSYPMTLAETASTFAEMLLIDGMLDDPLTTGEQKSYLLDLEIGRAAVYLLDIPVRYEFEKALYEERSAGELSVDRLKDLMVDTQQRVLGDVLEEGGADPYFWASKLHFYITGVTFYNFPYTFGFLLSRALFLLLKKEGPDFLPRYEAFLRLTGSDTPENIARRTIERDIESPDFWAEAILSLNEPLKELASLMPQGSESPPASSF